MWPNCRNSSGCNVILVATFKFNVCLFELRETSKMSVMIADPGPSSHYLIEMKVDTTKKLYRMGLQENIDIDLFRKYLIETRTSFSEFSDNKFVPILFTIPVSAPFLKHEFKQ